MTSPALIPVTDVVARFDGKPTKGEHWLGFTNTSLHICFAGFGKQALAEAKGTTPFSIKAGLAQMLKGGVIMGMGSSRKETFSFLRWSYLECPCVLVLVVTCFAIFPQML